MLAHRLHAAGGDRLAGRHSRRPLRLDRTIEVSVINMREKRRLLKRAGPEPAHARQPHASQPAGLRHRHQQAPAAASSGSKAWRRLVCRRGRAVRLVEELGLRTQRLQPALDQLKQISQRMESLQRQIAATRPTRRARPAAHANSARNCCHLMRITLESPATLRRRIARIAARCRTSTKRQAQPLRRQPAAGRLHRQALSQPRPELPGPDPGGQHGPDAGGRQVRVRPRLQVLHLCHLVDPPGHHPGHRRPEPHHPRAGPHDRDHEPGAQRPPRRWCKQNGCRADHGADGRGRPACRSPRPPA